MNQQELKKRITDLNNEIEQATKAELKEYESQKESRAKYSSQRQTGLPLGLFLIGLLGFTYTYFALGQGPGAYFFIFGVATPGALWFMVAASRVPKWSRWKEKETSVQYLNELYLEKTKLVKKLRQLERQAVKNGNKK